MKKIYLVAVVIAIFISSCIFDLTSSWYDSFDDLDNDQEKAQASIVLPEESTLNLSSCKVLSINGSSQIANNNSPVSFDSKEQQEMIYLVNENDEVMLLSFVNNKEESLVMNAENSALSLLMLLMGGATLDKFEWDLAISLIKENENFPELVTAVKHSIINEHDLFDSENQEVIDACKKIMDMYNVSSPLTTKKSLLIGKDYSPLVLNANGNKLTINNNGYAPAYEIKMIYSKDNKSYSVTKVLDPSKPLNLNVGSILTWTWGVAQAPSKSAVFELPDDINCDFSVNNGADLSTLEFSIDNITAINILNIVNTTFDLVGLPVGPDCVKSVVKANYNILVKTIRNQQAAGNASDVHIAILNLMSDSYIAWYGLIKDCMLDENSTSESKVFKMSIKAAKFVAKSIDYISKVEGAVCVEEQIRLWLFSNPAEMSFCKSYRNDLISNCSSSQFNRVYVTLTNDEPFYKNNRHSDLTGTLEIGPSGVTDAIDYGPNDIYIKTIFDGELQKDKAEYEFSCQIWNGNITDITIQEYWQYDPANYSIWLLIDGYASVSKTKRIELTNLSIPLSEAYNLTGGNGIYTINDTKGKVRLISQIESEMSMDNEIEEFSYDVDESIFNNDKGRIEIQFSYIDL